MLLDLHGLRVQGLRRILVRRCRGETVKDLAWSYKTPLPENVKIAGLVAFYNERADLIVDGAGVIPCPPVQA